MASLIEKFDDMIAANGNYNKDTHNISLKLMDQTLPNLS